LHEAFRTVAKLITRASPTLRSQEHPEPRRDPRGDAGRDRTNSPRREIDALGGGDVALEGRRHGGREIVPAFDTTRVHGTSSRGRMGAPPTHLNIMTTPAQPEDAVERRRLAEAKVAARKAVRGDSQVDQAQLLHELEVHQVELEMQLEAHEETRAALETVAHRSAELYAFAPVGFFTLESDGSIRELNFAAAKLLGTERAVGRRFGVFVAEASRSSFSGFLEEVFVTKAKRTCDIELASEGRAPIAVTVEGTLSSDGRECRAVVLDVTERKRGAERLARLQSITAALSGPIAPAEAAGVILSLGLAVTGAHAGIVTRAIDRGRWLEVLREVGEANTSAYARSHLRTDVVDSRLRFSIEGHNPISDAVRSLSAVWLQNRGELRAQYPEHAAFFEKVGYRAVIALPLISRGQLIGALRLSFSEERTLDAEERAFLSAFAQQCALALDRAQLYEDAMSARELAERATRMRDEFLTIVAHDLANPINMIGIWASLLLVAPLAGAEGETVKKGAAIIQKAVRRMGLLLHDLGDAASMDSGRLKIEHLEGDAETIVADVVEAYAPLCAEKGLSITGKAPALRIPCDRNRVGQVLGNFVANAIKFTPNGGTIAIDAVSLGSEVRFSVADTGPGIPEEARGHVFERYWRGKDSDYTKGIGLGLFISQGIIASHGGKIWVESTVGRGSTFYFTLPVAPANGSAVEVSVQRNEPS
jgi:signal transduction histidine kinase